MVANAEVMTFLASRNIMSMYFQQANIAILIVNFTPEYCILMIEENSCKEILLRFTITAFAEKLLTLYNDK